PHRGRTAGDAHPSFMPKRHADLCGGPFLFPSGTKKISEVGRLGGTRGVVPSAGFRGGLSVGGLFREPGREGGLFLLRRRRQGAAAQGSLGRRRRASPL